MGFKESFKRLATKRIYFFGDAPQSESVGSNAPISGINQSSRDWQTQLQYVDLEGERKWYDKAFAAPLYIIAYAVLLIIDFRSGHIFVSVPDFRLPRRLKTIRLLLMRVVLRILYFLLLILLCIAGVILAGYLIIHFTF